MRPDGGRKRLRAGCGGMAAGCFLSVVEGVMKPRRFQEQRPPWQTGPKQHIGGPLSFVFHENKAGLFGECLDEKARKKKDKQGKTHYGAGWEVAQYKLQKLFLKRPVYVQNLTASTA